MARSRTESRLAAAPGRGVFVDPGRKRLAVHDVPQRPNRVRHSPDASTGKTLWEYSYSAPFHSDAGQEGNGPHATPAIAGDRIFTTGASGKLHCLDKKTGKGLWEHDLWNLWFRGSELIYGYASSPLVYRDTILLPVGGDGRAMMCFRQSDGETVWKKGDAGNAYSSAVLIHVGGLDEAVVMTRFHVVAFNPLNGDVQWSHEHKADYGLNIMTPLWGADNLLLISASYGAGTTALELTRSGNQTNVKELWHSNSFCVKHVNMQRVGDVLYASSGDSGPTPLTAVDAKTGKILWRERGFPEANLVWPTAVFAGDLRFFIHVGQKAARPRPNQAWSCTT